VTTLPTMHVADLIEIIHKGGAEKSQQAVHLDSFKKDVEHQPSAFAVDDLGNVLLSWSITAHDQGCELNVADLHALLTKKETNVSASVYLETIADQFKGLTGAAFTDKGELFLTPRLSTRELEDGQK
jgi:hypothetical protein